MCLRFFHIWIWICILVQINGVRYFCQSRKVWKRKPKRNLQSFCFLTKRIEIIISSPSAKNIINTLRFYLPWTLLFASRIFQERLRSKIICQINWRWSSKDSTFNVSNLSRRNNFDRKGILHNTYRFKRVPQITRDYSTYKTRRPQERHEAPLFYRL